MILSDLVRGLAVGLIAVLAFSQHLEIWHIYAASVLFGSVDAVFQPVYTAELPEIAPPEILPSANSFNSISGQFASIVGPAVGGVLVGAGGPPHAFTIDAVSFLFSAICLVPLLKKPLPSHTQNGRVQLGQEIKVVFGSPWLWVTISIAPLLNLTMRGHEVWHYRSWLKTSLIRMPVRLA